MVATITLDIAYYPLTIVAGTGPIKLDLNFLPKVTGIPTSAGASVSIIGSVPTSLLSGESESGQSVVLPTTNL